MIMNTIKNKLLNKETISYLIFGILTTLVDFLTYILCTSLSVNYLVANIISWCAAVLFAYLTNKIFVFKSKSFCMDVLADEFISFIGARILSLIFSLIFIYLTVTILGVNTLVSKVISCIFVVLINYVLSKLYIFNDKNYNTKNGFISYISSKMQYIIAFLIPFIILIIIYYTKDIYPFGDNMYLRSDCYHQYAPFHKEFLRKLLSGDGLTYSWNIGLGVNFTSLYAYYLASPVNWFLGLVSEKHILEAMSFLIVVKTSLCSSTFAYYLSKHHKTKKYTVAAISVFYALSSYFAAFSWNLMWLDCLVLFPLIILGLEKLVKENKCYLYCITLGLAILSNYYIAIMICIFCVLYYFALIYMDNHKKTLKYYFKRFKNFALYSLLAGGFAAITFLPAFCALSSTASGDFDFPKTLVSYFSVFDMMSRSLITVDPAIFSAHDPNLYCSIIVFLLVPIYAINPKIKRKEKIAKISLACFMLFSFNTNIPNYIWHGFHYPNSLPARESFIYIFLVLAMSYEALLHIRDITTKQFTCVFTASILLFLAFEKLMVSDTYSSEIIYLSVLFLIFYLIALSLYRNPSYKQNFVAYLLFVVVISEVFVNTSKTALGTCTRSLYLNDNKPIENLVNTVKENDDSFFRIEKENRRTKNDAAWNNYYGASIFSSTTNAALSKYYGALGFEQSTNAYAYYGHTPLTTAMFSIKYVLSDSFINNSDYMTQYSADDNYYIYKNLYTLPLGFMMPKGINTSLQFNNPNPFEVQNNLCYIINDNDTKMYNRLMVKTIGSDNQVTMIEDTHLFIYVTTSLDAITVSTTSASGEISTKNYNSMTHSHILDLGNFKSGTTVSVASSDTTVDAIQLYAYSFSDTVFKAAYAKLMESPLNITTFQDTYIKGDINVKDDGMLYTSIPYDKGWTVYVDGKETKTYGFKDALLAVNLSSGKHTIELRFHPAGLRTGIILSTISIIIFISIFIADMMKRKRNREISKQHYIDNDNYASTSNDSTI